MNFVKNSQNRWWKPADAPMGREPSRLAACAVVRLRGRQTREGGRVTGTDAGASRAARMDLSTAKDTHT